MHKYDWPELITANLLNRLSVLARTDLLVNQGAISDALVSIFRSTGGLPVAEAEYDEAGKTDLAVRLLSDAINRYASESNLQASEPGYYLAASTGDKFDHEIVSVQKVNLNSASAQELEALPTIGKELAKRVVHERTANGGFKSIDDLTLRVNGVGKEAADVLKEAVTARPPMPHAFEWDFESGFDGKFKACFALFSDGNPHDSVARLLGSVASTAAADPHPVTKEKQLRNDIGAPEITTSAVDWIGVLANTDYYRRLPDLLKEAVASIKVAMFHAAFADDDHPTKKLLDELISARERGVDVKVLLDRDRDSDPYMSTVINSPAQEYLFSRGVDCRFDKEGVLLHSKFLVIDDQTCVIGSHNWTAGSYFQFDDLSIVVSSAEMGGHLSRRFDQLWPS